MKWIARVFVFTVALVFGTFTASLFGDAAAPITPIAAVKTPVKAENLLGTWKGSRPLGRGHQRR
jgi:hypothetical protein